MATVCFVGTDTEGIAQLAEALARSRSDGDYTTTCANVVAYDAVTSQVRDAVATSRHPVPLAPPRPVDPVELDQHQRVIVLGFRNAQGFVPLPPGLRPSYEVWPIEPPEEDTDPDRRMKVIRKNLEHRLARLVYDLKSPERECCGSGCANCVLDR